MIIEGEGGGGEVMELGRIGDCFDSVCSEAGHDWSLVHLVLIGVQCGKW